LWLLQGYDGIFLPICPAGDTMAPLSTSVMSSIDHQSITGWLYCIQLQLRDEGVVASVPLKNLSN